MDIIYLIALTILLVIISLVIMFKNDTLTSIATSFVILVIAGTLITTN
jgi:hypothetical protein